MRPVLRPLFVLVLLIAVIPAALAETITGKVVAIADGDTITVLQDETPIKVRLHGIDCPENGQDFGRAAKDYAAEQCFQDEVTVVVTDTDRYGRKVGLIVLADGRILNHELVAAGLAHWYKRYAPRDQSLERLQAEAKAAKRGLWSRPDVIAPWDFRRGERGSRAEPYNPPSTGGNTTDSPLDAATPGEATVYITETGTKYHREGCRFLRASKQALPRAEAKKAYAPCVVCKPGG